MDNLIHKSIENQLIFTKKSRLLIGVSGGKDSMSLCHALVSMGYSLGIAHVNYHLRIDESDREAALVENFAKNHSIPFYKKDVTLDVNLKNRQERAREIRYAFFYELLDSKKYDFIVVGHHANDVIETFFLHLMRGASVKGLKSMQMQNDRIVRPFIHLFPEDIERYVKEFKVPYLTDSSNLKSDYRRNFFRNDVLPLLNSKFLNSSKSITKSIQFLQKAHNFIQSELSKWIAVNVENDKIGCRIKKAFEMDSFLLSEYLVKYGFNQSQIDKIADPTCGVGRIFISKKGFQITNERDYLYLLTKVEKKDYFEQVIDLSIDVDLKLDQGNILFTLLHNMPSEVEIKSNPNIVFIDRDLVRDKVVLRNWRKGDSIRPLGMKLKKKKLQDIFVDKKISNNDKSQILIVEHEGEIAWIVGLMLSDKFKLSEQSKRFLKIEFKRNF